MGSFIYINCEIFLNNLRDQFDNMTTTVAANFMTRLRNLGEQLTLMDAEKKNIGNENNINAGADDDLLKFAESIVDDKFLNKYSTVMESYKEHLRTLQKEYYVNRSKELRNVDVKFI